MVKIMDLMILKNLNVLYIFILDTNFIKLL